MSFKLNFVIFKNEKPESKLDYNGVLNLKVDDLDALCKWAMSQEVNQYGTVELRIAGWKKTSKTGLPYISALAEPPEPTVDQAARSLASATDGELI
jgi:hypothetical protein